MIGFGPPFAHWDERPHGMRHRHGHAHQRLSDENPAENQMDAERGGDAWNDPRTALGWHGRGFRGHDRWHDFAPDGAARPPRAGRPGFHRAAGGDDDPFAGGRDWSRGDIFWRMRGFGRGFGGPGAPGRPGRPGRGGRPLGQGDLRWLVLDLIAAQPRHGYEIIKAIEEAFSGHYTPSPGVIYPTLTLLEETGLISGESQGSKKLYSLTDEGRAELEAHSADIQAVRDRLANARARFGAAPPPELFRAMDNLRAALQVRLAKGELSAETVQAMTAAIDRAAAEIERS